MLSNNDIRIVYLDFLQREPTDGELNYSKLNFESELILEEFIIKTSEYKINFLKPSKFSFTYQNDVVSLDKVTNKLEDGKLLGNTKISFITSSKYNEFKKIYIYDNLNQQKNVTNFMNIRFNSSSSNSNMFFEPFNHSQKLFMNECRFQDSFQFIINPIEFINVKIDKYPLITHKSCVLQKITLNSSNNIGINLIHNLENSLYMNTGILTMKNQQSFKYYEHYSQSSNIRLVSLIHSENTSLVNIGIFDHIDNSINNIYYVNLVSGLDTVIYILTSITQKNSELNKHILNNATYLTFEEIIQSHIDFWINTIWNTNLIINEKLSIPLDDLNIMNELNAINKITLFNIICDPFETNIDLDLIGLPILILLKPEFAKKTLHIRSSHVDFENKIIIEFNKTIFNKNDINYFLIKIALLSIHHWNYFRVTKDRNWLSNTGFSFMEKCSKVLLSYNYNNNNTLYNYLIEQSLYFMNQAIFELDYKNELKLPVYNLPYFDDLTNFSPSGTIIKIKLEVFNQLLTICLYNDDDTLIGYRFGGTSGYKLSLIDDTIYKFKLEYDNIKYHIRLIIVSPENGLRINNIVNELDYHMKHRYDPFVDLNSSSFNELELNSDILIGYEFIITDLYDVFKGNINTDYGENAFLTNTITNIIKPTIDYSFEILDRIEPYIIFNSYYNSTFYRSVSKKNFLLYKKSFFDTISDNLTFFSKYKTSNDILTGILEAGLEIMIGDLKSSYKQKYNSSKLFYNKLISNLKGNTLDKHWFEGEFSGELLFIILTNVFELYPYGEIQRDRMKTNEYQLLYLTKNILPEQWKDVSGYNIGIDNQTININNRIFYEDPFLNYPNVSEYTLSHNELQNKIIITLDFTKSFPTSIPSNFNFYFYLQDQTDQTDYTLIENSDELLALASSTSVINQDSITISYIPITNIITSQSNIPITEIQNRIVHFIYDISGNIFKRKTFNINDLSDIITINPIIHATINYEESPFILNLDISYNSLYQFEYTTFSNISFSINYDNIYFNNISYNDTSISYINSSNYTDIDNIFTVDIETTSNIVSSLYNLGTLKLEINENALLYNYTNDLEKILKSNNILISNKDIFPPTISKRKIPIEFIYPPDVISNNYSQLELDTVIYHPITNLYSYNTGLLSSQVNSLLINGNTLINVLSGLSNAIFIIKTPTNEIQYYGVGYNEHNMLMTNNISDYLDTPVRCLALDNTINGSNITDVFITSKFSIIKTLSGKLYGIGNNEKYNLGDYTNINRDTLVENILLNNLLQLNGAFTNIVLNEHCVLVQFGDKTLYIIGEMLPLINTQIPLPLTNINSFLLNNGYKIIRIEAGKQHFKFLLEKEITKDLEWWGIGKNIHHNMCINKNIDDNYNILYLQRLHQIEKLIHGNEYDTEYNGYTISKTENYHFITSHGFPSMCTLIFDITTKEMYKMGTFDEINIDNDWIKLNTNININNNVKFFSLCDKTFVYGN